MFHRHNPAAVVPYTFLRTSLRILSFLLCILSSISVSFHLISFNTTPVMSRSLHTPSPFCLAYHCCFSLALPPDPSTARKQSKTHTSRQRERQEADVENTRNSNQNSQQRQKTQEKERARQSSRATRTRVKTDADTVSASARPVRRSTRQLNTRYMPLELHVHPDEPEMKALDSRARVR